MYLVLTTAFLPGRLWLKTQGLPNGVATVHTFPNSAFWQTQEFFPFDSDMRLTVVFKGMVAPLVALVGLQRHPAAVFLAIRSFIVDTVKLMLRGGRFAHVGSKRFERAFPRFKNLNPATAIVRILLPFRVVAAGVHVSPAGIQRGAALPMGEITSADGFAVKTTARNLISASQFYARNDAPFPAVALAYPVVDTTSRTVIDDTGVFINTETSKSSTRQILSISGDCRKSDKIRRCGKLLGRHSILHLELIVRTPSSSDK